MRIVIVQTTIVIDLPDEAEHPAPKPVHPLSLLELLQREVEQERETPTKPPKDTFYGTFLT